MSPFVLICRTFVIISALTRHILLVSLGYLELEGNVTSSEIKESRMETNSVLHLSTDKKELQANTTQSSLLVKKGRNEYRTEVIDTGGKTKHSMETPPINITRKTTRKIFLNKPVNITWKINGQYLYVSWRHSNLIESIKGYYVSLCAWQKKICNSPDFLHYSRETMRARIAGLAPDSTYVLKVNQLNIYMPIGFKC